MKNVYLISTNKGQRITKTNKGTFLFCSEVAKDFIEIRKGYSSFHLYITSSDEEIKEGDWYYWVVTNMRIKAIKDNLGRLPKLSDGSKKIILTTDEQLINDGVQPIDNEFLEWFVKNPSCESVEVTNDIRAFDNENREIDFAILKEDYIKILYKIIIPSEEYKMTLEEEKEFRKKFPKEFALIDMIKLDEAQEEPKQETIEEAAEKLFPFTKDDYENRIITIKRLFWIDGAKWQAERMYSKEEVLKSTDYLGFKQITSEELNSLPYQPFITDDDGNIWIIDKNEWYKQFKKK
jgi:hypothetical protein